MAAASAAGVAAPLLIESVVSPAAAGSSCNDPFATVTTRFDTTPAITPATAVSTKAAGTVLDGWTVVGTNVDAIGRSNANAAAFTASTTTGTVIIELSGSHLNPNAPGIQNSGLQRAFSLPCGEYRFGYLWQHPLSIAGTITIAGTNGTLATQSLPGPTMPVGTAIDGSLDVTVALDDTVTITVLAGDHTNQGIRITNLVLEQLP
jgi:hypothetical protein